MANLAADPRIVALDAKIAKIYALLAYEGDALVIPDALTALDALALPAPLAKALRRELVRAESDLARFVRSAR